MDSTVIGIDLGTSTTEAAVYRNGKTEMIPNPEGKIVTPSLVGIDDGGNWVVGEKAKAQLILSPENTAMEVKRKTGTGQKVKLGKAEYTPVELQAKLLNYVRTYASAYLGEDIRRAVISVPAYFNEIQRQETIRAGIAAGFEVERIINEPTAASLTYGIDHMEDESHIMVYDLGGGTFDVTLLEMFSGVVEVKASSGDNQLGGKDFDEKLMEHLYRSFRKKKGINLRGDRFAAVRIKEEAEKCKIALSRQDSYQVLIPAIASKSGKPLEVNETITREMFEEMCRDLLDRTHHPIDVVLQDSGLRMDQIDKIILVGGSSRMPMVSADIESYTGKKPEIVVDPDFAVSEGAAVQAGMISGEIKPEEGLIMTDVNPYTLGIACITDYTDDYMSVIIPRNVTIPTSRTEEYQTVYPGQQTVEIVVYQGESEIASHNHLLGRFDLSGFPRNSKRTEPVDVEFTYDMNGMLKVKGTIRATGKEAAIQINMHSGEETPGIGSEKEKPSGTAWYEVNGAEQYQPIIRMTERLLDRRTDLSPAMRLEISAQLEQLKEAIVDQSFELADAKETLLQKLIEAARSKK